MLKVELEEAKKIEDILRQQLTKNKIRCEKLEEEVVSVRKELEKFQAMFHKNFSSIKASEELNNILNKQRSPLIKYGLGYEQGSSNSQSKNKEPIKMINVQSSKQSEFTKSANSIKAESNNDNSKVNQVSDKNDIVTGIDDNPLQSRNNQEDIKNRMTRQSIPRGQPRFRYKNVFNGYCFCCSNFGHKAANCVFNFRHLQQRMYSNNQMLQHRVRQSMSKQERHTTQPPIRRRVQDINVNPFDLLYNELGCYVCHNFGHKASYCYLKDYKPYSRLNSSAERKVWKKKESNKCGLVLSAQRQKDP